MEAILKDIKSSIDTSLFLGLVLIGSGASYLRSFWAVFGVNLYNNVTVSEMAIGGINAGYNILSGIILLLIGHYLCQSVQQSKKERRKLIINSFFVCLLIANASMLLFWLFGDEVMLIKGIWLELISFLFLFSFGYLITLLTLISELFQVNKLSISATIILTSWVISSLDSREDALQIKHKIEYEYIDGTQIGFSPGELRVIGKLNGYHYFLDDQNSLSFRKVESLLDIKSQPY
ncbi:MAG: hypothetical protein RIF46_15065 [Cyclobacteriaceae bacterium]